TPVKRRMSHLPHRPIADACQIAAGGLCAAEYNCRRLFILAARRPRPGRPGWLHMVRSEEILLCCSGEGGCYIGIYH
ncbi:MAG TPA: hypothetical protein VFF94_16780, partial [Novosphingobium sp.]|nr:hypothetical protein [Novosphingobium sp.]